MPRPIKKPTPVLISMDKFEKNEMAKNRSLAKILGMNGMIG